MKNQIGKKKWIILICSLLLLGILAGKYGYDFFKKKSTVKKEIECQNNTIKTTDFKLMTKIAIDGKIKNIDLDQRIIQVETRNASAILGEEESKAVEGVKNIKFNDSTRFQSVQDKSENELKIQDLKIGDDVTVIVAGGLEIFNDNELSAEFIRVMKF